MKRRLELLTTPRLMGLVSCVSAVSLLADALSPLLIHRAPALLVVASPRSMYLLAVTHQLPLLVVLPLVTLRLCATDPIHFELGRRIPVRGKARLLADSVPRSGLLALVAAWPVSHTMLASGAAHVCGKRVAVANLVGTAMRVALTCLVVARVDGVSDAARTASRVGPLACGGFVFYALMALALRRRSRFGRGLRLRLLRRRRRRHQSRGVDRGFRPAVAAYACQSV